jgi:DNA-binding NarL/FixJ family response regulator
MIITLSNQSSAQDIERAKKVGVDGYIIKATTIPSEVYEHVHKMYEGRTK